MRILYVYEKIPGIYQNYLIGLLEAIKSKVIVKTLVYSKDNRADYSVITHGYKDRIHRFLFKLGIVRTRSRDISIMQRFEIVHLQHSYLWQKFMPFLKVKKRPKLVITLRGADTYLKPWSYFTFRQFLEGYFGEIDAFIVMSNHQQNYLERWGVRPEKIYKIPISFGNHSEAKPKYPNESELKLVSAFRMTWEKNIEGTIKFANALKTKGISFSFDIFGAGQDLDQLYFLVDQYKLNDCVNIKRKIENTELKKLLKNYDFLVQLSLSESLGMTVIEAQSFGVPCIVSDSGGLPEVVKAGETAIVGPYEEIDYFIKEGLALWRDREKYRSFSEEAIRFVNQNFTIEKEENRLMNMYEELLKT